MLAGLALPALTGLAACGGEPDRAGEPEGAGSSEEATPGPTPSPSPPAGPGDGAAEVVALVDGSAAGGSTRTDPVVLDGPDAAAGLGLDGPRAGALVEDVEAAARRWRAGGVAPADDGARDLVAAVAHVGCDVPREVEVDLVDGALRLDPVLAKGTVQCLVPSTTVVLVEVPAGALRG